jgi:hypothetical protein
MMHCTSELVCKGYLEERFCSRNETRFLNLQRGIVTGDAACVKPSISTIA